MPGQLGVSRGSHFLEGRDLVLICAALNVLYLPNLLKPSFSKFITQLAWLTLPRSKPMFQVLLPP